MSTTPVPPLDLSQDSPSEFKKKLGEMVHLSLQRSGACVLVARGLRQVSILNPQVLDAVPDDDMADALLSVWTDEEILEYLVARKRRRSGG